jgi:PAS domain S-box-containing protein
LIDPREVQAYADQLRLLTDAAPIGIFQTDAENKYVYTNPRWSEITGTPPEAAAGRERGTILSPEVWADLPAELDDVVDSPEELSRRFELQVPGSASRIVLVNARKIPDSDGGIAGWVGTLADVTAALVAEMNPPMINALCSINGPTAAAGPISGAGSASGSRPPGRWTTLSGEPAPSSIGICSIGHMMDLARSP